MYTHLYAGLLRNVLDESPTDGPTGIHHRSDEGGRGRCGDEKNKNDKKKIIIIITIPHTTVARTHGTRVCLINASDDDDDDKNNNNMSIARGDDELNPAAQSMLLFTFCRSVSLCHSRDHSQGSPSPVTRGFFRGAAVIIVIN